MNEPEDKRQQPQIITSVNSRDDPLRIQPARCYHSAQTRPAPKATQTGIEKVADLPPGALLQLHLCPLHALHRVLLVRLDLLVHNDQDIHGYFNVDRMLE